MQIKVLDPQFQTALFTILFVSLLLASIKKSHKTAFFPASLTQELKGFAILAIIFSHIGYFLSENHQFLYPLSMLAGVGVNLFLFLSGFGLTLSQLKNSLSILNFYKKRLLKLFFPLWIIVFILLLIDSLILGIGYTQKEVFQAILGFFPKADIFSNLNAPLWYFTFIFFYYLVFPLLFWKRSPFLGPILMIVFSTIILNQKLPIDRDVLNLYKLHSLSFPLGMLFAIATKKITKINFKLGYFLLPLLIILFISTSFNSGVGETKLIEQTVSLITMFCVIFIFLLKPIEIRLFSLFGIFSYEIYLIHWPLMYRYDLFYKLLPESLATLLYLFLFLILGYALRKLNDIVYRNL